MTCLYATSRAERVAASKAIRALRCPRCDAGLLPAAGRGYTAAVCVRTGCPDSYVPTPVTLGPFDGTSIVAALGDEQDAAGPVPEVATFEHDRGTRIAFPAGTRKGYAHIAVPPGATPETRVALEVQAAAAARRAYAGRWGPLPHNAQGLVAHHIGGVSYTVVVTP